MQADNRHRWDGWDTKRSTGRQRFDVSIALALTEELDDREDVEHQIADDLDDDGTGAPVLDEAVDAYWQARDPKLRPERISAVTAMRSAP